MINKVTLIGVLERNAELRQSQNGIKVLKFFLATEETFNDKKSGELKKIVEWHNVVKFSPLQEASQFTKGTLVFVEGKLKTSKYQHKLGIDVYNTSVIADRIYILREPQKKEVQQESSTDVSMDIMTDDIPF
ncbi:MAG: single-stranded DNA-binding protein [Holosporaceae bacterium]|jgi:single-strand DNA-binding protein|nr:single-stranded DNA-binding protein [Holosporaceae bacterium]